MLMNFIILAVLVVLMNSIPTFYYLYYLYDVAGLIPTIALGVRRLHDIGKSGLWLSLIHISLRWSAAGFLLCAARRKSIRRNLKK